MNEAKINELSDQISKMRAILNDLTAQLEAEKNKSEERKEPSIEDRWTPNENEKCFAVNGLDGHIAMITFEKGYVAYPFSFYRNYNVWKTTTRAEEVFNKTKLLWLMEQIHDIICPDYEPDWEDDNGKFYCAYNADQKIWESDYINTYSCNVIYTFTYFDTLEHVEQACKILNNMGVKPI